MSSLERVNLYQPLVHWTEAENGKKSPENTLDITSDIRERLLRDGRQSLAESDIPILRYLSGELLKRKSQNEGFSLIQARIETLIASLSPFEPYFNRDLVGKIVEYLPLDDGIKHVVPLSLKDIRENIQGMGNIECSRFAKNIASILNEDPAANHYNTRRLMFNFLDFFFHAELAQQESFMNGWIKKSSSIGTIFDLLPEKLEKLFLYFDLLENHQKFPEILNRFSHLKVLQISRRDCTHPLGILSEINFSKLVELDLRKCEGCLDNSDLDRLMANPTLKNLRKLDIRELEISSACVHYLQTKFPDLEILTTPSKD